MFPITPLLYNPIHTSDFVIHYFFVPLVFGLISLFLTAFCSTVFSAVRAIFSSENCQLVNDGSMLLLFLFLRPPHSIEPPVFPNRLFCTFLYYQRATLSLVIFRLFSTVSEFLVPSNVCHPTFLQNCPFCSLTSVRSFQIASSYPISSVPFFSP
ncbi:uncharacterized protein DEA37_0005309 [Paragonimus westermani]|uniref:Uncharacterized protein n=1 Tax=Paragonimus westermani TaxID=34504 RepID=A0A5J4NYL1_9TREM|nr:uncharacterized protein DEA37_0005309 [Paragonimus westermani]